MTDSTLTDIDALVSEFADLVVAQNEAIQRNNPSQATRCAKQRVAVFSRLRTYGNRGRNALTVLLADLRPGVRVMAAAYLLRHRTEDAIVVLEEESEGEGLTAFAAAHALSRWYDGTWNYDLDQEDG